MARLVRPPGLLSFVEGFLNLRGTALPVLRLDALFWLSRKAPELYTLLVVLQGAECSLALLADRVHQIASAPEQAFRALSQHHCFNDCAETEVTLSEKGPAIPVLSVGRLLLEKERQSIAQLQAMVQQRLVELEAP